MNKNDLYREIRRMEAECCAELPEIPGPGLSLVDRAIRLLRSEDPPRGKDRKMLAKFLSDADVSVEGLEFLDDA